MDEKYIELDKKVALIEQRLDIIQNNHLKHIQDDICTIKKWFAWGVGAVFIQLMAVIAAMAMSWI
jgi:hypothetical protein